MRTPLTRPEVALAGLTALVLAAGSLSALALDEDDDASRSPAAARSSSRSPTPTSARSTSSSTTPPAGPSTSPSQPAELAVVDAAPSSDAPEPGPALPADQVAAAFFDAAVQGRDADALALAEPQVLSDLREYEAWEGHRLSACEPEAGLVVCVLSAETTFLRLLLRPDPDTGWRVLTVE